MRRGYLYQTRKLRRVTTAICPWTQGWSIVHLRRVDPDAGELGGSDLPPDCVAFVRDGTYKKPFLLKLSQVVLPLALDEFKEAGMTRADCLGMTLLPPPHVGSPQVFLIHTLTLATLRDAEQEQLVLGD